MANVISVNGVPVPPVPTATTDPKSLQESVAAIKANVEALTGVHSQFHINDQKSAIQTQLDVAKSRALGV